MNNNCTFTFTAPLGPTTIILRVIQDATGSRVIIWPSTVHPTIGILPVISTAANAVDIISMYFDGTNYHLGIIPNTKTIT